MNIPALPFSYRIIWPTLVRVACLVTLGWLAMPVAAQADWPRSLRDSTNFKVVMRQKPVAIISLTLATDEILFDLVDRQRLKGITFLADDPGISNITRAARNFPVKLSGEKEQLIVRQPDLVLVADWKEKEFVQSLRDAGLTVYVFHSPDNFPSLFKLIRELALLTGDEPRAETMVRSLGGRLQRVADRVGRIAPGKRFTVLSYSFFGTTYAEGTSFDYLVQAAGLVNAATRAGLRGWPQLSKEQVISFDPDFVIVPSWSYEGKVSSSAFRASFLRDPVFASLRAVKTGKVIILPDTHLLANSQFMVDAVEDLARAAYPELMR